MMAAVRHRLLRRCTGRLAHDWRPFRGFGPHSTDSGLVAVGDSVLIGPRACIGGTQYHHDRVKIFIDQQGSDLHGGISTGSGTCLGAGAAVLDGITIGRDAIVAGGAVVTGLVRKPALAGGIPAKIRKYRGGDANPHQPSRAKG